MNLWIMLVGKHKSSDGLWKTNEPNLTWLERQVLWLISKWSHVCQELPKGRWRSGNGTKDYGFDKLQRRRENWECPEALSYLFMLRLGLILVSDITLRVISFLHECNASAIEYARDGLTIRKLRGPFWVLQQGHSVVVCLLPSRTPGGSLILTSSEFV